MTDDHIVEVYVAGSVLEVHALADVLEEAGVHARITGEMLNNALGGLPLGEETSPRIWVHEREAARAREVISRWIGEAEAEAGKSPLDETGEQYAPELAKEQAAEEEGDKFNFLSPLFVLIAMSCVAAGAVHAYQSWQTLRKYSETVQAVFSDFAFDKLDFEEVPASREIPFQKQVAVEPLYQCRYTYVVDGKQYDAVFKNMFKAPRQIAIQYDPQHPEMHVIGPLMPPWLSALLGVAIGSFVFYVAYKFR
jgi:hypothetical protein